MNGELIKAKIRLIKGEHVQVVIGNKGKDGVSSEYANYITVGKVGENSTFKDVLARGGSTTAGRHESISNGESNNDGSGMSGYCFIRRLR